MRLGLHYMLGLLEASMGIASAERRAQVLETDRETASTPGACALLQLNRATSTKRGSACAAPSCCSCKTTGQRYLGTSAGFELRAHAANGDLLGVKRALDALAVLAEQHAGWRPVLLFGQCRYAQLQGDPTARSSCCLRRPRRT